MVCRSSRSSSSPAGVSRTINRIAKNLVQELLIVGDDGGCQMMAHSFATLDKFLDLIIPIYSDHLEWTKDFCSTQLEAFFRFEDRFEWNKDSCKNVLKSSKSK